LKWRNKKAARITPGGEKEGGLAKGLPTSFYDTTALTHGPKMHFCEGKKKKKRFIRGRGRIAS
jgi:hypothetical protein